jgi:hypothetical protein
MAGGILDWLRARLGAAVPTRAPSREFFLDEDFYGEIEVLPDAIAGWCREELRKIEAFSDAHLAPGGQGWTDIYVRPPAPMPLADLAIPLDATTRMLGTRLRTFDRVTTGRFSAPETLARARAFGPSPQSAVVVVGDAGATFVDAMMLVLNGTDAENSDVMAALGALPPADRLIVVDWARGGLLRLR